MKERVNPAADELAETIGLQALTFLLGAPRHAAGFLDETGLTPDELARNAQAPHVLEAALSHLMANEALLLSFAANADVRPEAIAAAHDHIATGGGRARPQWSP